MDQTLDRVWRETASPGLDMCDDIPLTAVPDMRSVIDLGDHVEDARLTIAIYYKRIDLQICKMLLHKKTIERDYLLDSSLGKISDARIGKQRRERL